MKRPCKCWCKCKICRVLSRALKGERCAIFVTVQKELWFSSVCIDTCFGAVLSPEKETNLRSFVMRDLLPSSVDSYYRYTGSLTMPPCSKVVEWIIFSRPVYLSHSQVRSVPTHTLSHTHTHAQTGTLSTHSQIPFSHSQWIPCCSTAPAHRQFFPSSTSPLSSRYPCSSPTTLHMKP